MPPSKGSATPRSILKATTPEPPLRPVHVPQQHHHHHSQHPSVRFPSSPKLSTVHLTHCSTSYDRTPIVVLPNSCAIPERGCRSYSPGGTPLSPQIAPGVYNWGKHVHPSLLNRAQTTAPSMDYPPTAYDYDGSLLPPPLTSDDGSSEDSDGVASPPPEAILLGSSATHAYHRQYVPSQSHLHSDPRSHPPIPMQVPYGMAMMGQVQVADAPTDYSLSFLPHAPPRVRGRPKGHRKELSASYGASGTSPSSSTWDDTSCLGGF